MGGWLRPGAGKRLSREQIEGVRPSVERLAAAVPELKRLYSELAHAGDRLAHPLRFDEAADAGREAARLVEEAALAVCGMWSDVNAVMETIAPEDPMVSSASRPLAFYESVALFLRHLRLDEYWGSYWSALEAALPQVEGLPEKLLHCQHELHIWVWRALARLPGAVMERGYGLITGPAEEPVTDAERVAPGDRLTLHVRGQRLTVEVVTKASEGVPPGEPAIVDTETFWRGFMA